MGKRARISVGVFVIAIYVFNPLYIRTGLSNFASSITSFANLAPVTDPNSLKVSFVSALYALNALKSIVNFFLELGAVTNAGMHHRVNCLC